MGECNDRRPLVAWLIFVYDTTAEKPYPLKRKWYRFDYDKASDDETAAVLGLVSHDRLDPSCDDTALESDQATERLCLSGGEVFPSPEIIHYRHLFVPVEEAELNSHIPGADGFLTVMLRPDSYFEDENEKPISFMEVHDREARREGTKETFAIVPDHPETILRFGPAQPIRPDLWSQRDADLLAQFFDTYNDLISSKWLHSRCEVVSSGTGVHAALLPLHEDCMSVILPFRQLYSSGENDNLFNRCCGIHNRHCPPDGAHLRWIQHYKCAFNAYLDRESGPTLVNTKISVRRYLDAFAYGARIVHATSKTNEPQSDLKALLSANASEMVALGYHFALGQLLGYVSHAVPIIRQNVHHWTADLGWPKPTRPVAWELFKYTGGAGPGAA